MHEQSTDHWLDDTISGGLYHVLTKGRTGTFGPCYNAQSDDGCDVFIRVPPLACCAFEEFGPRFLEIIRELRSVSIARVSRIIDLGFEDNIPFVVIQRPDDGHNISSIDDRCFEGLSQWLPSIANTLDELHGLGYRHCDICPENIWIDQRGETLLFDFGVGQAVQAVLTGDLAQKARFQPTEYLAPELIPADSIDGQCDQFSLAVTVRNWLDAKIHEGCGHAELHHVLERATARDPNERFFSCSEFVTALRDAHAQNEALSTVGSVIVAPFTELDELPCPGCGYKIARHTFSDHSIMQCPAASCGLLIALDDTGQEVVERPFHCPRCRGAIPSRLFSGASQVACPASECGVSLEVDESGKALREAPLDCPVCKKPISLDRFDEKQSILCPHCRRTLQLDASGQVAKEVPPEISIIVDSPEDSSNPEMVSCPNCEEAIFKEALRGRTKTECPKCSVPLRVSIQGILTPAENTKPKKEWRKTATIVVLFLFLVGAVLLSGLSTNLREFVYDPVVKLFTGKNEGVTGAEADDTNASELARAEQFMKEGNDTEAIALLQQLLEDNPEDSGALKLKAEIELAQGKKKQAISTLTTAVRVNLSDADAYLRRAKVNLLVKDYKRAISDCTDALRTRPDWKEAYVVRSKAYEKIGNTSRAERDRKRAGSIRSD